MRLTNVAQMDLVSGRLFSYAVRAAPTAGRRLPVSWDQGRHVGEGQRPGSWMAMAFRLTEPTSHAELGAAWDAVVARHGTLRTVFTRGADGALALHEVAVAPGSWTEHPAGAGQLTRDALREVLDAGCAPFERPSHRLCIVEPEPGAADPRPDVVIGADHAHLDMWSLVILARELIACLGDVRAGREPGADLPPVATFAEHTAVLEAMSPAPEEVQRRWAEILTVGEGAMPVFPLDLGAPRPVPAERVEVRDVLDIDETARLEAAARAQGVRPIALAVSVLTDVTLTQSGRPLRAVFPVHSRHEPRWRDAVGWFITNAVIETADPDPGSAAAAVAEAIELGSWPLAPILSRYGRLPAPPGHFALSWLDTRRLPVPSSEASAFRYVSARIRTDGVMLWFMVNESGLHLRCRYPDTPEARGHVGPWLDAVEAGLRGAATSPQRPPSSQAPSR